jgi:NADH-quinone oxidoreductase subunit C
MGKKTKALAPPPDPVEPEQPKSWGYPMDSLLEKLAAKFPEARIRHNRSVGEPAILIAPHQVLELATWLKENDILPFSYCRSVTGTDKLERYEVAYNLAKLPAVGDEPSSGFHTIAVIVYVTNREDPKTASLTGVWPGADFQEREVFDLLGINFDGHPDLRRILLDEAFKGHPLRKDYPLIGRWEDMVALDASLDEHQVQTLKEEAGLKFEPEDVPPGYKR